jgi:NADH-quinone oxidoreductase subunit F
MTPARIHSLDDLERRAALGSAELYPAEPKIIVGTASCARSAGAMQVLEAGREEVERQQLDWRVTQTGCMGWCSQEPLLDVWVPGHARVSYGRVTPARARQIVRAAPNPLPHAAIAVLPGDDNALTGRYTHYTDGSNGKPGVLLPYKEVPLFRGQHRIAMRNCGLIDPRSLDEYIARGGYSALWHALRMRTPQQVIDELRASGLRERSGSGAEVGARWQRVHDAAATPKCLLCSLHQGGGCADRQLLESDPNGVLEGLIIGAYGMGASQGIIHLIDADEVTDVVAGAIHQAKSAGLLGGNILDSGFGFDVRLVRGSEPASGCREESAFIHAIEQSLAPLEQVPSSSA